jgi:hypothetical protein
MRWIETSDGGDYGPAATLTTGPVQEVVMAKTNSTKPPSYRLHRASGQAVVTINRKDHYLGVYGMPNSRLYSERLISAWMQGETTPAPKPIVGSVKDSGSRVCPEGAGVWFRP